MTVSRSFKYRAFLSYSHRDHETGEKLHKALENFRIPWGIAGKDGSYGKIPGKLRPIFRDRFDLEAGHSLGEQVTSALDESEALIVICSPASAKSKYVQSEIINFKRLGRSDRIYPIIVDGEPGDPDRECFPPPLRFKVTADGTVTTEAEEPLAADARPQGDGEDLARLKLIAGLLGVDLDELRRREAEDERRWKRIWAGVAGAMTILAIASAVLWRTAETEREQKSIALIREQRALYEKTVALDKTERLSGAILDRTSSLVSKSVASTDEFGVPVRVGIGILKEADGIFGDMDRIGVESKNLVIGRTHMLLSFADSLARLGKVAEQKEKSDSALALANGLLAKAPDDPDVLSLKADALARAGHVWSARYEIKQALASFNEALDIREKSLRGAATDDPQHLNALSFLLKDIAVAHNRNGEPKMALEVAQKAVTVANRLAGMDGQELAAAEARVPALIVIADMYRQLGRGRESLDTVTEGVSYVDQVLALTADSVPWLRRKSHFLLIKGDVHKANRDYDTAMAQYEEAYQIRNRLHEADIQNATIAVEAGYGHIKIGEVLMAKRQLDLAQGRFEKALELYDAVIKLNPDHQLAARTSLDALDGLGEAYRQKKQYEDVLKIAQRKFTIADRIAKSDVENRDAHRALARVKISLGNAYRDLNDETKAIENYKNAQEDMQRIKQPALSDERELADALEGMGELLHDKRKLPEAADVLGKAIEVRRGHAERAEPTIGARLRYANAMSKLFDVKLDQGDTGEALRLVISATGIREPLLNDESSDETRRQVAYGYEQLGRVKLALKEPGPAIEALQKALPLRTKLNESNPKDAQRRRNLAMTWNLMGEAQRMAADCAAPGSFGKAKELLTRAISDAGGNEGWSKALANIETSLAASAPCASGAGAAPAAVEPAAATGGAPAPQATDAAANPPQ